MHHELKILPPYFEQVIQGNKPFEIRDNSDRNFQAGDTVTCRQLLALLSPFQIGLITSDDWGSYAREVPAEKHLTGKIYTQRIERNNLTLRIRLKRLARKTICFSRSVELHEKVIGAFIEKYHFN